MGDISKEENIRMNQEQNEAHKASILIEQHQLNVLKDFCKDFIWDTLHYDGEKEQVLVAREGDTNYWELARGINANFALPFIHWLKTHGRQPS